MTVAALLLVVACSSHSSANARSSLPRAAEFSVTNGGLPFAGDHRLLTTISPNGDGVRDAATIHFRLTKSAAVHIEIREARPPRRLVFDQVSKLGNGAQEIVWAPAEAVPGTYQVRLDLRDDQGNRRRYATKRSLLDPLGTPVVRVLGVESTFTADSALPGGTASLEVKTDAPTVSVEMFRSGKAATEVGDNPPEGALVRPAEELDWSTHTDGPFRIDVPIGEWPSGVYYARVTTGDGRVGLAPVIVRPTVLGVHRVAVVLPTNTWQAYNFRDEDGNGIGDTWYAHSDPTQEVRLGRAYLNDGMPPHYARYDLPFLRWLGLEKHAVDYLTETDLEAVPNASALAATYDLIIYPGHNEYVTQHEYALITKYRDLGGNLMFLSANNFFWRVDRTGDEIRRVARWRTLGRPEAALIGVQYLASDAGERKAAYIARPTDAAGWLFPGTGFQPGLSPSTPGGALNRFGIEIDATTDDSPPGTTVVADIPNLFGRGMTAQMTYYETPEGAKVFAAGAFTLAGAAGWFPVRRLLVNLWDRMARP